MAPATSVPINSLDALGPKLDRISSPLGDDADDDDADDVAE